MISMLRRWWWVPAGLGGVALASLISVYVYPAARETISFVLGRPYFAECTTAIKKEAALPSGRYRITEHVCGAHGRSMYIVFLLPANDLLAMPLFNSVDLPVPEEVREHDARTYEIVLAEALPDGSDRLPVRITAMGVPERQYNFFDGRPSEY
jgi:hypothetical protein